MAIDVNASQTSAFANLFDRETIVQNGIFL